MATGGLPHYQPLGPANTPPYRTYAAGDASRQFNVTFRRPDRLQLTAFNCRNEALQLVQMAVTMAYQPGLASVREKQPGTWTLKLMGNPFARGSPRQHALPARELACELISGAMRHGWLLAAAAIVTNQRDSATWFFRWAGAPASATAAACCCLDLAQSGGIRFFRFPAGLADRVCAIVGSDWPAGFQTVASSFGGDPPIQLRLSGGPWTAQKASGVAARRMLVSLVRMMRRSGWELLAGARIKDTNDSLFFCPASAGNSSGDHPDALSVQNSELMLMSLHNRQSVRLEGGNAEPEGHWLAATLARLWHRGVQSHGNYYGAVDVRLAGSPWLPSGDEAKSQCRQLLSRLLAELRARGWRVLHTLDISRRYPVIKSAFLLVRWPPESLPHCCVWASVTDRLSFVDVPDFLLQPLIAVAHSNCSVISQVARPYAYELKFKGKTCTKIAWRCLLSAMLDAFCFADWELVCTGNVSGRYYADDTTTYSLEVHSWWFAQVSSARLKAIEASAPPLPPPPPPLHLPPPSYESLFVDPPAGLLDRPPA